MNKKKGKFFINHFVMIGGGTAINLLIGLITTPMITRIVDPVEYGKWSIFTMYAGIGLMVFCLGLDQSLVRFFYREDDLSYKSNLINFCWRIPVIGAISFGFLISFISYIGLYRFEFETGIIVLLCFHIVVLIFNRFGQLVLRVSYKSGIYSLTTIVQKLIYVCLVLLAVKTIKGKYFVVMVIATIISYVVPGMISVFSQKDLWLLHKQNQNNDFDKREIILYGLPFILSLGITTIFQSIDKMSLNYYCDYIEVGVYSSAMTLVHIFAILQTTFNTLWTPLVTEYYEKNSEERSFYQKGNRIITVLMFAFGISLILIKDIFALLLGVKYREAAFILPFLIFNPIMYTISESTCMGIGFLKKTKMNIVIAVTACTVNIVGNILLVPFLAGRGAAISTGLSYIVFWAMRTIISNYYYYVDFGIKKFLIITLSTVVYALYSTFYSINLILIIGYFICMGILIALYHQTVIEIIQIAFRYIYDFWEKYIYQSKLF